MKRWISCILAISASAGSCSKPDPKKAEPVQSVMGDNFKATGNFKWKEERKTVSIFSIGSEATSDWIGHVSIEEGCILLSGPVSRIEKGYRIKIENAVPRPDQVGLLPLEHVDLRRSRDGLEILLSNGNDHPIVIPAK
ncbi:MAG: hypothetical protein CFE26_03080 [Verrucomicrobiales bacterium VVV1]|nr:MAG: hypothetical protein CFE26_03080 [Verrucomicrobiales bacterium VVV1]